MSGIIVLIVCIVLSVLTYRKISKHSRNKSRGKFRTLITSSVMSFIVFIFSLALCSSILSQDKSTDVNAKGSMSSSTEKKKSNVYKCDKFDAITQTRQGTKYDSGYYSDKNILIEYTVSDDKLIMRMPIPGEKDSINIGTFKNIAADGSRKYGNSSENYFVSELNDTTIKVITINFNVQMTLTQVCSK